MKQADQGRSPSAFSIATFIAGAAMGAVATISITALINGDSRSRVASEADQVSKRERKASKEASRSSFKDYTPSQASNELSTILKAPAAFENGNVMAVIEKATKHDAQRSLAAAAGVNDPGLRRKAMQRVIGSWVLQDRQAAMEAIAQVDNVALRKDLMQHAVNTLAYSNPSDAVALLNEAPSLRSSSTWFKSFESWAKIRSRCGACLDAGHGRSGRKTGSLAWHRSFLCQA